MRLVGVLDCVPVQSHPLMQQKISSSNHHVREFQRIPFTIYPSPFQSYTRLSPLNIFLPSGCIAYFQTVNGSMKGGEIFYIISQFDLGYLYLLVPAQTWRLCHWDEPCSDASGSKCFCARSIHLRSQRCRRRESRESFW